MTVVVDVVGDRSRCGPGCDAFLERWSLWWERQLRAPMALLRVTDIEEEYMYDVLDGKARNMVRTARRLYVYREFNRDGHLDELYAINTSKRVRSGGPMTGHYLKRPEPTRGAQERTCARHRSSWRGGFRREDGALVTYCNLVLLNDLAVVNTFLSHADARGAGNGLFDHMVAACRGLARWIHYLTLSSSVESNARFKMSVGFRETEVIAA